MSLEYIIAISFMAVMVLITFFFAITVSRNESLLRKRIQEIEDSQGGSTVPGQRLFTEEASFFERILLPYAQRMYLLMERFTPKSYVSRMNERLVSAGDPMGLRGSDFVGVQGLFGVIVPLLVAVLLVSLGTEISMVIMISLTLSMAGFVLPMFMLSKKISERQEKIRKILPFSLDLLTVSVDAGLGFDSAMSRVVVNLDGPVSEEFDRVLREINFGKARKDALRDMVTRSKVKELSQFVVAIIQADKLGIGLSKLLRVQSKQMRLSAKQRAQERAFKAPVKMLFPMILFIFPAIFVILLGPAILILPSIFGGM